MEEITKQIVSDFSSEITENKVITIFRGLGFEIEIYGDEYYAHKGNIIAALIVGMFSPKIEIYYSISEVDGKVVINLRSPIGFWKGGGALGMERQKSKFRDVVTTLSSNLTTPVEGKAMSTTPVAGTQFCPNCGVKMSEIQKFCPDCGTNLTTYSTIKKTTIVRKIGAAVCIALGLFIILLGSFGIGSGMDHESAAEIFLGITFIAIGIGITWFGWSHRK